MRIAGRISLALAAIVLVAIGGFAAKGLGYRLPPLRDHFGPVPRFNWIADGRIRPTPHIAEVEEGLASSPLLSVETDPATGRTVKTIGASPSDCFYRLGGIACLRQNWLGILGTFKEGELTASEPARAYRFLEFPSFSDWLSFRVDLQADGSGTMTIRRVDHSKDVQVLTETRTVNLFPADVAIIERSIKDSGFYRMTTDPSALLREHDCFDGEDFVVEAHVRGRYRYVARHNCEQGGEQLGVLGRDLAKIAWAKTHDPRLAPR